MNTPVLLLVYNRPEQTLRVLQRLKECGATNVFVSGDGPRNSDDRLKTQEVRSCVNQFETVVSYSRFADRNQGCKKAVIEGVNWFFEHVEEGIILEDDCLPGAHFFPFIEDMLDRYRDEKKVMTIGGNNPLGKWQTEGGHFFSRIGTIWGWATWKNRWQEFNPELPELNEFIRNRGFELAFGPTKLADSRKEMTKKSVSGEIDTWDYQWNAHILISRGVAVIPEKNLIENIGFDSTGTHTFELPRWISNTVADHQIEIDSRPIEIDREYEMEWELARRSNLPANHSSTFFCENGRSNLKSLRILLINSTDIGGGAEKIALTLHQRLIELGLDSKLLVQQKKSALNSVMEINDLKNQVIEFRPDVIHAHNLHGTTVSLTDLAHISQRIPTLFTLHDSWLSTGSVNHPFVLDSSKLNLLELMDWKQQLTERKSVLSSAEIRFATPSQWMSERMFDSHGIRPFFVLNAVESIPSIDMEIPSNRFILFVANRPKTNPYKDFSTLKKALKKANSKLGPNGCDLIVLGGESDTEKFENYSIIILENQSAERVRSFMEQSVLVVQASVQDNAPLTILESHAAGKKVLASLVGGVPELLDDEEQSWMYEAENVNNLAKKLFQAILSKSESKPLSHVGIESMTNTYLGHYVELVNGH